MFPFLKEFKKNIIFLLGMLFLSVFSFSLGYHLGSKDYINFLEISGKIKKEEVSFKDFLKVPVVGNKKSKIYFFPWCKVSRKIKKENQIWFSSAKEAEKKGFRKAKNCE